MTNYRVKRRGFGEYKAGAVLLPAHLDGNDPAELVRQGWLEPTTDPHTEDLKPRKAPVARVLPLIDDVNRLKDENTALRRERDDMTAELAKVKAQLATANKTVELRVADFGAAAGENRDLRRHIDAVAADKDALIARLERENAALDAKYRQALAEMAQMTGPAPKADPKDQKDQKPAKSA